MELSLLHVRELALEHTCEHFASCLGEGAELLLIFCDKVFDGVAVDTCEACLLELALEQADECHVKLSVHEEYVVSLVLGIFNETELLLLVIRIEVYDVAILVGLLGADKVLVLLIGVLVAVGILQ